MSTALHHLRQLVNQNKAQRNANVDVDYIPCSKHSDRDENGLTTCIVDYLNLSGFCGMRSYGPGRYRSDAGQFISPKQRDGFPMVCAIINSQAVFVEVVRTPSQLSQVQKKTILDLIEGGALIFVAYNFEGFYRWFEQNIITLSAQYDTPNLPPHPIPWLATPDLPPLPRASQQEP